MRSFVAVLFATVAMTAQAAEDPTPAAPESDTTIDRAGPSLDDFKPLIRDAVINRLKDKGGAPRAIGTDELQMKYLEPDSQDGKSGWGVFYNWAAAKESGFVGPNEEDVFVINKLKYDLKIQGSYALSDATNNDDYSTATAAVHLEHGNRGPVRKNDAALSTAFFDCLEAMPQSSPDPEERRRQDALLNKCILDGGIAALVQDEPTAYFYEVDLHGGVEANQDYTQTRSLYGVTAIFVSEPSISASRYNLLDLPFRAVRNAMSRSRSPYLAPFPSVLLAVERLDAKDDEQRSALTTKTTFTRVRAEVGFQTIVASFDAGQVRFNASYRYFREFSPPSEIEAAGLDHNDFTKVSLRFPARMLPFIESDDYELYVGYTNGQLPFDQSSGAAVEIGFATNIELLGRLLAQ